MTRSQSYINLADDLALASKRFGIENFEGGGTSDERSQFIQAIAMLSAHARTIGLRVQADEQGVCQIIDLARFRVPHVEGWQ